MKKPTPVMTPQHRERQAIEAQRKARREAADVEPLPERLGERAARRRMDEEFDADRERRQRRHADGARYRSLPRRYPTRGYGRR